MNVRDLKKLLEDVDDNREVVLSSDAEGNGHSPLGGYWRCAYRAENTWSGEVGYEPGAELPDGYDPEDDVIHDGVPALVLQPTN